MRSPHTLRGRVLAPVIGSLVLLSVAVLGGCSAGGGVSGSIGHSGAHIGANIDLSIYDPFNRARSQYQYDGQTVYVVPDHNASP
ncbi:MAG: hypothetical protein E2O40_03450 [Planctomycetota bacterium]|nr:MAG: hypothetical protein E2O40_03450 [Planctomycetota bacterium]